MALRALTRATPAPPLRRDHPSIRSFQRAVATTVAGLAFAAAGISVAGSAAASPEDGKGCVGTPGLPASYVCVISTTPENVVPGTSVTNVPVTVPKLCYFLDCTEAKTVLVPVPGVTPRTGVVAVLWYQGQYIPVNVGTGEATALLFSAIDLATRTATGAVGTANDTVAYAATLANGAVGTAIGLATSIVDGAVTYALGQANYYRDYVNDVIGGLPTVQEIRDAVVQFVRDVVNDPQVQQVIQAVQDCVRDCFYLGDLG